MINEAAKVKQPQRSPTAGSSK